ncbi:BLUF domain-containing protein [Fluviispira multicolorata]|uniref:BLUF domain-containing protein n=1 Tax=Fluviispira multicolorata TaxID=2654512 RepID=A0A833JFX7_9BACT|nr:BLUF domain-containing protein [Fluviispira multicolorata]KAB8033575.1 hypothetical protein GCL57_02380 [Fluviispira multicolorata]
MTTTQLHRLLYRSEQTNIFQEIDLQKILNTARDKNAARAVTGLLISRGLFFLQLLEGNAEHVVETFYRIKQDARHKNVEVIVNEEAASRVFPNWSMGLIDDTSSSFSIPEMLKTIDSILMQKEKKSNVKIVEILRVFSMKIKN